MTVDTADVHEEYFENEPTGVELENDDDLDVGLNIPPYDPTLIRVGTKQFSLRNILDLIKDGDLELAPDFQRNTVWKVKQKSRLIESILLQIPLPAFYFAEDADGLMRVVDGLQRLSTVNDFVRGQGHSSFMLKELEYLRDVDGRQFEELSPALKRRIYNTQIVVHVIDPKTPNAVTYDIFKRINTGGTPLNAQEIRHCMSRDRSRKFLKRLAEAAEFDKATSGRFRNNRRMDDRELALRYCAFQLRGVDDYVREGAAMDYFLGRTTQMLDDPYLVPDDRLERLYEEFRAVMVKCYEVFGVQAFRKWPRGFNGRHPLNRPLFESWSNALSAYELDDLKQRKDTVVAAARDLMTYNRDYVDAISTSTGGASKVRLRFHATSEAARAGL
jgi:hypothetical protein